jgi:hypothetical protein
MSIPLIFAVPADGGNMPVKIELKKEILVILDLSLIIPLV